MATIDNDTVNQHYQLPDRGNPTAHDVERIRAALAAIDNDVAQLFALVFLKAGLESPALTGAPTAPTQPAGTNDNTVATTGHVQLALNAFLSEAASAIETIAALEAALGDADLATALLNELALKAPLANPVFTGIPTAPTAATEDNGQQLATTAFVQAVKAVILGAVPTGLNTLAKIAAALGNDASYSTTITNALAAKAPLASPSLTGTPTAPTAALGDATTKISTTAFVQAAINELNTAIAALLAAKAPLASPALTGEPTAPTPAAGNNTTRISTTAFVQAAISQLASAVASDLATKAPIANPTFTGSVTGPNVNANDGNVSSSADGNRHFWFRTAAGLARAVIYHANADGAVVINLYDSAGAFLRNFVLRGDGYAAWNGGEFNVGSAKFQSDGNVYMPWAGDWLSNVLASKITTNGRAYPRRIGGGDLNFNWSGQPGQPSWLWGGEDGTNMYVYSPANFSVAYAANAGALGGSAASAFWTNLVDQWKNSSDGRGRFLFSNSGWTYIKGHADPIVIFRNASDSDAARIRQGGTYENLSDQRTKYDIVDANDVGLEQLLKMQPRRFKRNGIDKVELGWISQEVREVLPDAVKPIDPNDPDELLYVNDSAIVVALVKAVKDLSHSVDIRTGAAGAITARQLRLGLLNNGISPAEVQAVIEAMPAGPDREKALVEWEYTLNYERSHPLIATVAQSLGLTDEQIDAMWTAALSL